MACCLMAITWTNADLSSVKYCGIHLMAISHEMLKTSTLEVSFKITNLRLYPHLPGTNELIKIITFQRDCEWAYHPAATARDAILVPWHVFKPLQYIWRMDTHRSLRCRHNRRDGVSNHQPQDCLRNRLFRSKKTSKLRVTGLCAANLPGIGEFPAQMASNAENVSIWWRHHVKSRGVRSSNGLECLDRVVVSVMATTVTWPIVP